jgi:hypothetical protein
MLCYLMLCYVMLCYVCTDLRSRCGDGAAPRSVAAVHDVGGIARVADRGGEDRGGDREADVQLEVCRRRRIPREGHTRTTVVGWHDHHPNAQRALVVPEREGGCGVRL